MGRQRQMIVRLLALLALGASGGGYMLQVGQVTAASSAHLGHATPAWTLQHSPTKSGLRGISCTAAGACYAVGVGGTILTTTGAGAPWTTQHSPTTVQLSAISCPATAMCYAVGSSGTVVSLKTAGGAWHAQTSNSKAFLTGVTCRNTTTCFAVGTNSPAAPLTATIMTTHDGGATWTSRVYSKATGGPAALFGVTCSGSTICYAVGTDSTTAPTKSFILTTMDAGRTWTQHTMPTPAVLTGITCPNATSCYALGTNTTTSPTKSYILAGKGHGGAMTTWTVVQTFTAPAILLGLTCPSANACNAVGADSVLSPTKSYVVSGTNLATSAHWTAQKLAVPGLKVLFGMGCTTTACYGVGNDIVAGPPVALKMTP